MDKTNIRALARMLRDEASKARQIADTLQAHAEYLERWARREDTPSHG